MEKDLRAEIEVMMSGETSDGEIYWRCIDNGNIVDLDDIARIRKELDQAQTIRQLEQLGHFDLLEYFVPGRIASEPDSSDN